MKNSLWLISLAGLTAFACAKDDDKKNSLEEGSFGGQTYYVVDAGNLERSDNLIKGSGSIVFSAPLNEIPSQDNFAMDFSLVEGGSLSLIAHADSSLEQGLTVQFDRSGRELKATLKADGNATSGKVLSGVDASGPLSLAVDVHNNETPAHILIWNAAAGSFDEDDAIYNSENDEAVPGVGKATLWGLILQNAELSTVTLSEAKLSDE